MIKEIEKKIRQYEKQKQIRLERKQKLEAEIENINLHLKELYGLRKQYEKLEKECESVILNLERHCENSSQQEEI
ncbi:hypothetical protein [uncultured Faecalicoccus sp.]|uniref:hypothetical protein n=1 Tax=uncultured Faecalicoccus sp. TaxID=1971760 RepID=UPI00258A0CCE|nr:hypothetical protein [uncultured Faecalicoccus sp.]